jgi:hypothetical protein
MLNVILIIVVIMNVILMIAVIMNVILISVFIPIKMNQLVYFFQSPRYSRPGDDIKTFFPCRV